MAEAAATNEGSSRNDSLTPAERLLAKHTADEAHRPTVEEVVDEEDIAHPPPSSMVRTPEPESASSPAPAAQMSEKAAGKQKAQDSPETSPSDKKDEKPVLNVQSEEAFPALGAPKPRAPMSVPAAWGKKPASVANGADGATNGISASSNVSSRASTPASGMLTPTSTNASQAGAMRGPAVPKMSQPGQHKEHIQFAPSQMVQRNQLKKPIPELLRDISKRSGARVESRIGPGGVYLFEGQGQQGAVRQALKEVAKEVGSKQSVKVAIPASVRPHVIGRQGATIQGIQKRTGARVNIPKQDDSDPSVEDDDDGATIDVVIEGDALAAEMARREVEAIVNERTSNVNMRLKSIPPELYPFLAGPRNSRISSLEQGRDVQIQIPQYHTWSEQAPPQPAARGQPVTFAPQANFPVQISGDRGAAQEIRAELERRAAELQRQLTADQMSIERGRHQFIFGDGGDFLHDLLEETGCTVIQPPPGDDSETLIVVGPPDKIEDGINKVMELAASMSMTSVDVARQHANAPMGAQAHARNLTRYLRQRQAIEDLERMHNASITLSTSANGPTAWEVFSRDGKNTMRARTDIMNLISGHPPSRLANVDVDPFYHQHLRERAAEQMRNDYGVHLVFPEELEASSPQLLLVYEGPTASAEYQLPRRQPSAAEVREFEKALQEAQQYLLGLTSNQEDIVHRDVDAPAKFHDKVRRYVDREQQSLPEEQFPVQLLFGGAGPRTGRSAAGNGFSMRGPSSSVDDLYGKILAFIEQEERDELERGYTTSFDFPQKFANQLIGRGGENIKKLREEYDVEIQVNDGKVELKGPKAKADAAKAHILAMARKLEDEATHTLKIKPQFHRDLIGNKGSQVNRLQDRYNVRINFPRTAASANEDGTDAANEASPPQRNFRSQAPDEVIIRGPRRGADEAREELLNLLQWTMDNSHTATVSVAQNQIPSLIGQGGREMEALRLSTGAQIDVPNAKDVNASGRAEIKLKGTKKAVEDAKKLLEERAKVFDATVTRTIDVDKKHHRNLIGSGGANIHKIVVEAGGPDDRREATRMVRFPRPESDDNTIRVEGIEAVVGKIIAQLEALVSQRESQITESLEVAPEKHRLLIGRGGETRRNLESQFNIGVDIPKQGTTGPARSQIKLTGQPADVEKAKVHILSLVKNQEGETIDVPRRFHHAIADNGQFFRRLRNDHKVTVDHAGQQPPARPASTGPDASRARVNAGALPLITDDAAAANDPNNFSWEVVDAHAQLPDDDGSIPWVLHGSGENVARARKALEAALEAAQKPGATGYLILPDPRAYRYVVGPGGAQINSIRKRTGTKVTVPRDQARGEAIEIRGAREGVEEAKEIILELVRNGGGGGGNGGAGRG